jgi:hypothetical protein
MGIIGNIFQKAVELLENEPAGLRYTDLCKGILSAVPGAAKNTVKTQTAKLAAERPKEVYKPARGLFRHVRFREVPSKVESVATAGVAEKRVDEEAFYRPFAEWLQNELEEVTRAVVLGGNRFRDKWGTPDVIGKRQSKASDIVSFPTEIVSAEIKLDASSLITAFGQACAYKLFSHKSYLVVPRDSPEEDLQRLDALCMIFGIGLVLFDATNPESPSFDIRVRAAKHEPDMFYVNAKMKLVEEELFS